MENIMTLGIFAHANAGKTTLTEEFLVHAKAKSTVGRVDHGNTTTDSLEIEQRRGISVKAAMVTLNIHDRKVQLIDTPGHVDFSSEVERAISVLDGAILVLSGVEGVEPQTQVIWNILRERNVPTLIFINKMDRVGADYDKVLKEMKTKLNPHFIPKVRVTKTKNGLNYEDVNIEDQVEEIAELDDKLLERYISDDNISKEELLQKQKELSQKGECFLVYGGSALNDEGVKRLLDAVYDYLPCYESKRDTFSGYIYNVDRSSGVRELYVKVLSGELKAREKIQNAEGEFEQIRNMSRIDNISKTKADVITAGEIGIISGLTTSCGTIIGDQSIDFKPTKFVNPLFETTINAMNKEDSFSLVQALGVLNDEDPDLHACLNRDTGEVTIKLMGALQGEVIKNIIETRFNIPVIFTPPIILQKETPTEVGGGHCAYTKVSRVGLEVRPLPRNSGLVFKSELSTDILFSKYQKQVERLIYSYAKQGLYGWEVTDCEVVLVDGKCDNVGSEPEHFNIATPIAFMRALKDAEMQLLEPTVDFEINVPREHLDAVVSALFEKLISYEKIEAQDENVVIKGNALLRLVLDLPANLVRVTSGHASMIQKPSKFVDSTTGEIITRNFYGLDPRNEEAFVMKMNGSFEKLDMAPPKRRKMQKKPNRLRPR